ncbi:MAG: RluA family pseudouridine synthase [Frankiaceae bacterium]
MRVTERRRVPVPEGLDGLRLDAALARLFGLSRACAADLVEAGDVLIDGVVRPKSERVVAGTWLDVAIPPPRRDTDGAVRPDGQHLDAQAASDGRGAAEPVAGLRVVYCDDDIVVVDKPPGVAAHPSPGWDGPTVVGGLAAAGHRIASSGAAERQGVVHRLDAGTSGLMVVAKSEPAYSSLKAAFRGRAVDKDYRALVQGHPDPLRGSIDAPIDRHPTHPYKFAVVAGGRASLTHYETVEAFRAASLLEIRLATGRTHQIRVHMAAVRHPCVGDLQYGADPVLTARLGLTRQWLHAWRLAFAHPADGRWLRFESPDAPDLAAALALIEDR